jgi:hypothetical protein
MQEELAHRNMAFSLYQADEMPLMRMGETRVERIAGDVWRVWVDLANDKVAPTITARAGENHVVAPDLLTLAGDVEIISAGWVQNRFRPGASSMIDQHDLTRIQIRNGHPGQAARTIEYLVKGSGNITVRYESLKGGTVETSIPLRATVSEETDRAADRRRER